MSKEQPLETLLRQLYPTLSRGQRQTADVWLEHWPKLPSMTAKEVAERAGVSESTVVRLAGELGFDGYPHFLRRLREDQKTHLTAAARLQATSRTLEHSGTGPKDLLGRLLEGDLERLRYAQRHRDGEAFHRAQDLILGAQRIFCMGLRSAQPLASFLSYYLTLMCPDVRLLPSGAAGDIFEQAIHIGEGDLLLALSFPRYSVQTLKVAQLARSNGAEVLAITDHEHSPLAQAATANLIASSDMVSFVDSLVVPFSLISALLVGVAQRQEQILAQRLDSLEHIWDEAGVYDKILPAGQTSERIRTTEIEDHERV